MSNFMDFFDFSKEFKRTALPGGQTQGHAKVKEDQIFSDPSELVRPAKGLDYVKKYKALEQQEMQQACKDDMPSTSIGLGDVDDMTSIGGSMIHVREQNINEEELIAVYDNYDFSKKMKVTLPITRNHSRILSVVDSSQSMVLYGATGCGKSTQVPQYILDSCVEKRAHCNIVVTQPRRIAAISLAKRVCHERNWQLGTLVGYQVGLDRVNISADTRLMYCTTGVLLQMVINEKILTRFTHIILDEVHERSQDMDFLFILVKRLLMTNSKNVKVILMSATIDVSHFSKYFTTSLVGGSLAAAPVVDLNDTEQGHSIEIFYLCSLKSIVTELPSIRYDEPGISPLCYKVAMRLMEEFDRIEEPAGKKTRGAVLVFLPGIHEIEELFNLLKTKEEINKWWIKPLHSTITTLEQELVFKRPPEGYRKIILSTNIAESSITVPDITFVVDFVLTKHMLCDPNTNFQSLQMTWASKSNCTQRAGRSGRVAAGRVFRLVSESFYESLPNDNIPEIQRSSLERTVLQTKLFDIGPPKAILALALDPPDLTRIEQTILMLKEKGALLTSCDGRESVSDGDITFLGRVMAKLPVDPVIAKLILLGHVFSVLKECIIMGAAMSLKSLFSSPFQLRLRAYHSKLTWADSSCSDPISFLNAFTVWSKNHETGYFNRSVGGGEAEWAARYYVQLNTMREVDHLVQDIEMRLRRLNIETPRGVGQVHWNAAEKSLVLKIVLAGAFYPNYFSRGTIGGQVNERDAVKLLDGRDPFCTVYLQNMPIDQPRLLYAKRIRDALSDCCPEIQVSFDNSSKVYVQFGYHQYPGFTLHNHSYVANIPGKVAMSVYRAIKFRQLGIPVSFPVLNPRVANIRARELGLPTSDTESFLFGRKNPEPSDGEKKEEPVVKPATLPSIASSTLGLRISHLVNAGHFWAISTDPKSWEQQRFIYHILQQNHLIPVRGPVKIGAVYAVKFMDESNQVLWYRARVDAISNRQKDRVIQVFYLDYGNCGNVPECDIMDFDPYLLQMGILQIQAQAFECMLSRLQPSAVRNDTGLWTNEATLALKAKIGVSSCFGKIYSVVNGVIHLELLLHPSLINLNKWLIEERFADDAEESYLSKENNKLRTQSLQPFQVKHYEQQQQQQQQQLPVDSTVQLMVDPPDASECTARVTLRGPTSPLEMSLYSLTRVGLRRTVSVDRESVNSILLDTDPQDPHERLLVAASIGENPAANKVLLRHTTMMPNIHGLAALVCLIFAPKVEFRVNKERTRITGAICGLGVNNITRRAVFPDHDMEVTFDTEFTSDDIEDINKLRLWMNECVVPSSSEDGLSDNDVLKGQVKVKETLFELIQRPRKSVEPIMCPRQMYWGLLNPKYAMCPTDSPQAIMRQKIAIFKLHWGVRLRLTPETKTCCQEVLENAEYLRKVAAGLIESKENMCMMCIMSLDKRNVIRAHLATQKHRQKERAYKSMLEMDNSDDNADDEEEEEEE